MKIGRQIIGLTGYARSGKDTVAKLLEPYGFTRVALADGVREMALAIDPIVLPHYNVRLSEWVEKRGWDEAKAVPEVRRLLQVIGTEAVRDILGQDTWIKIAGRKVSTALQAGQNVVITDVRFPNEARWIRDIGGKVWRILRPGVDPANGHASELEVDGIGADRIINNDGEMYQLRDAVDTAMGWALGKAPEQVP